MSAGADLGALDDPARLATASDLARATGNERDAALLRLRLLRHMLAARDQMAHVLELADRDRAEVVRTLEDDLIEQLIRPAPGAPPLSMQLRNVLDAEVALLASVLGAGS